MDENRNASTVWALGAERRIRAMFREATSPQPVDGVRPATPETRVRGVADLPESTWRGIMVEDCGYQTTGRMAAAHRNPEAAHTGTPLSDVSMWLIGRDEWGQSACVWVDGSVPYFYVGVSHPDVAVAEEKAPDYADMLADYLDERDEEDAATGLYRGGRTRKVLEVRPVKRGWFYGYRPDPKNDKRTPDWRAGLAPTGAHTKSWAGDTTQASDWYLKVTATAPFHVNKLRKWADTWAASMKEWRIPGTRATSTTKTLIKMAVFEANVEFPLRFMIDRGLVGFGFCAINETVAEVLPKGDRRRVTDLDYEVRIDGALFEEAEMARDTALMASDADPWEAMRGVMAAPPMRFVAREERLQRFVDGSDPATDPLAPWFERLRNATAPMHVMSFDIECLDPDKMFPDPLKPEDSVIGICSYLYRTDRVAAYMRRRAACLTMSVSEKLWTRIDAELGRRSRDGTLDQAPPPVPSGPSAVLSPEEKLRYMTVDKLRREAALAHEKYEKARALLPSLAGDGFEHMDCLRSRWPPPHHCVAMGVGTRNKMPCGMDGYPVQTMPFNTERELLLSWAKLVRVWDPDVIEGYNSVAFDMAYIFQRAKVLGIDHVVWKLGRFPDKVCRFEEGGFSNKARGKTQEMVARLEGRLQFDILKCCHTDVSPELKQMRSYKLDAVARQLVHEGKTGIQPPEIPDKFYGTPADRSELDAYCDADAVLPFKIDLNRQYLTQYIEMARVCGVPFKFLTDRGQQVRAYAQILRKTRERGMAVPWLPVVDQPASLTEARNTKAYKGALVINPTPGYYTLGKDGPTFIDDFASLYPSWMRAANIGPDTAVMDSVAIRLCADAHNQLAGPHDERKRRPPPGEIGNPLFDGKCMYRDWELGAAGWKIAPISCGGALEDGYIAKPEDTPFVVASVRKSVVSEIEEDLMTSRKVAKAEMAKWLKGSPEASAHNGRQMALKVVCNSMYGFLGAILGRLACLVASAAITAYGRAALYFTKRVVETVLEGDNQLIYGDSVTGDTPVIVRFADGKVSVRPIELVRFFVTPESSSSPVEVWSDVGWTRIRRVIRHKSTKRIFQITTHRGCVKVTEDHSLLRANGDVVRPVDLRVGHELLHVDRLPPLPDAVSTVVGSAREEMLVAFESQALVHLAMGPDAPSAYTPVESAYRWWRCEAEGGRPRITMGTLKRSHDGHPRIMDHVRAHGGKGDHRVIDIVDLGPTDDYVYDLETENHHFAAGVGRIVVHNTDSVMVIVRDAATGRTGEPGTPLTAADRESVQRGLDRGKVLADIVTKQLPSPVELQLEKVYAPYLLNKKKRYAALYWANSKAPQMLDAKGIEGVRRDNPLIVGMLCKLFTSYLMGLKKDPISGATYGATPDVDMAIELVRETHRRMICGELPVEAYVVTGRISRPRAEYKSKMPHVETAHKMALRDPASAPAMGSRVAYAIVTKDCSAEARVRFGSAHRVWERAEDPAYIKKRGLTIDTEYYSEHKMLPPFLKLLTPVLAPHIMRETVDEKKLAAAARIGKYHQADLDLQRHQTKRHKRAEKLVRDLVFRENYGKRKMRKELNPQSPMCAHVRVHKRPRLAPPRGDAVSQPAGHEKTQKEEDVWEKELIEDLLKDIERAAYEKVSRKRKREATPPAEKGVPSTAKRKKAAVSVQTELERFFRPTAS